MWNQGSYDPRSYESNLCSCLYRSLQKARDFNGVWTYDPAIPVRWSNQLSYEATDVGSWSFVGRREPMRNECELIIRSISYIEVRK